MSDTFISGALTVLWAILAFMSKTPLSAALYGMCSGMNLALTIAKIANGRK